MWRNQVEFEEKDKVGENVFVDSALNPTSLEVLEYDYEKTALARLHLVLHSPSSSRRRRKYYNIT